MLWARSGRSAGYAGRSAVSTRKSLAGIFSMKGRITCCPFAVFTK